jgi:hypothetical protein
MFINELPRGLAKANRSRLVVPLVFDVPIRNATIIKKPSASYDWKAIPDQNLQLVYKISRGHISDTENVNLVRALFSVRSEGLLQMQSNQFDPIYHNCNNCQEFHLGIADI